MDSAPRASSLIDTAGPSWVSGRGGLGQLIAGDDDVALEQDRRTVLALVELGAQRRMPALLRLHRVVLRIHQAKLEGRDLAQQILDLGRVLHAGQLHVDPIQPLALHDRLRHAQLVDAIHERGAVLLERVVLARLDLGRRQHHVDRRCRRCRSWWKLSVLSTFLSAAMHRGGCRVPAGSVTRRPSAIDRRRRS